MEQLLWSVDDVKYEEGKGQSLRLDGWIQDGKDPWQFVLLGDGLPVDEELSVLRGKRPDVEAIYPDREGLSCPGFSIRIPGLPALLKEHTLLEVAARSEEGRCLLWSAGREELREFLRSQLLEIHLDRQEVIYKTMVVAEGWAMMQRGRESLSLLDASGHPVSGRIVRGRRPDVVEERGLEDGFREADMGFSVRVRLEDLKGKSLILSFEGDSGEEKLTKTLTIDVKRLQAEGSLMGRRKKVLAWENRRENLDYLRRKGLREFLHYVDAKAGITTGDYEQWLKRHRAGRGELRRQRKARPLYQPLVSIVIPLYNTPIPYFKELLDSIRGQTYRNWQLCLGDGSEDGELGAFLRKHYGRDHRIRYKHFRKNRGISRNTNLAAAMASGDLVLFCDHDDVLEPDALYRLVEAMNREPEAEVLYTDEDKISMDGRHFFDPNLKPDFSLFRLRENNYICHIFAAKKELLGRVGLLRPEFDGAQDFDLILRCCEQAKKIVHVPRVLYHWRCHMESTAADPASKAYAYEAGRRALLEHYRRLGIPAEVSCTSRPGWYKSQVPIQGQPLVSIIIPNKDHVEDLKLCLSSIREKTSYPACEILVVENNSVQEETFAYYRSIPESFPNARVLYWKSQFNFSAINNFAAREARGEYLLFLNNDVEIQNGEWLEEMLMIGQQEDVGIVGAKLFYPDGTIQHAGVVLGLGGIAGHILCQAGGEEEGYMGRLVTVQETSAVTAACLLIRASLFSQVGGFDEGFQVAFNDIDLCMKVRREEKLVVFTPYARLCHYESKSRGLEDTPEKQLRFKKETSRFQKKWKKELEKGDPYYSPNLSVTEGDCSLREV
ncbi:MAG: glycosyltransferase family 2 protein [Eubacteriales bacterium]|nr:glycosyltransferase family 2 protein [Eubacteriales bacterium]